MTVYELIKTLESSVRMLDKAGVTVNDIRYLEMFEDYVRLKKEGHKSVYIIGWLSDVYDISESTVWKWIRRYSKILHVSV
jgi:hypothetical protein